MHQQKILIRFLVLVLSLVFGWFILYDIWLNSFDEILTTKIAVASGWFLNFLGFKVNIVNSSILMQDQVLVYVGAACNAMVLMALFAGFIVAYPKGDWIKKIAFIAFGILLINVINIIRVSVLALNAHYSQQTLNFNHKYTFTIVVYGFIFGLWMLWVKKLSVSKINASKTVPAQF